MRDSGTDALVRRSWPWSPARRGLDSSPCHRDVWAVHESIRRVSHGRHSGAARWVTHRSWGRWPKRHSLDGAGRGRGWFSWVFGAKASGQTRPRPMLRRTTRFARKGLCST